MCCIKPFLGPCRMVHDTDIVELELRSKRFSLAVRKKEAIEALEPQVVYQVCLCQRPTCLQSCRNAPAPAALLTAEAQRCQQHCALYMLHHHPSTDFASLPCHPCMQLGHMRTSPSAPAAPASPCQSSTPKIVGLHLGGSVKPNLLYLCTVLSHKRAAIRMFPRLLQSRCFLSSMGFLLPITLLYGPSNQDGL